MRPSRPSKMPAAMIANTAASKFPFIAKRIAVIPAHSASKVRMFGTMRLTDRSESRRARIRGRRTLARRILTVCLLQSADRAHCAKPSRAGSCASRSASTVSPPTMRCPAITIGT